MTFMVIINLILKNWKIIVGFGAGFALAWWIQGVRVDRLHNESIRLKAEVMDCQNANKTNQETIISLKKEIADTNTLCSSRLKVKDSIINRLRDIDNLKPNEGKDEEGNTGVGADAVLRELSGMFKTGR